MAYAGRAGPESITESRYQRFWLRTACSPVWHTGRSARISSTVIRQAALICGCQRVHAEDLAGSLTSWAPKRVPSLANLGPILIVDLVDLIVSVVRRVRIPHGGCQAPQEYVVRTQIITRLRYALDLALVILALVIPPLPHEVPQGGQR